MTTLDSQLHRYRFHSFLSRIQVRLIKVNRALMAEERSHAGRINRNPRQGWQSQFPLEVKDVPPLDP